MPEESGCASPEKEKSPEPVFMEDPSEYRPELKDMSLGKEQDDFRVFYKVLHGWFLEARRRIA